MSYRTASRCPSPSGPKYLPPRSPRHSNTGSPEFSEVRIGRCRQRYNLATVRGTTYLLWRATVAVVLMIAFYGLALAAAGGLFLTPFLIARVSWGLAFKSAVSQRLPPRALASS